MQASVLTPKVLIIEDSITVSLFMAQALEKAGYHVIVAADGREGLMKAFQEVPHCLVLDVILPEVSGFEVCRRLRARDPLRRLPIIMVSIKNTPVDSTWGLSQGADRYLPKPFTEETLLQTVEEILLERSQPPWTQRVAAIKPLSPPKQEPRLALHRLIPRRDEDANLMSSSNPLSGSVVISDKQARRLYASIDGRKNVAELCAAMNLALEEVSKALQILLAQRLIHLDESGRRLADNPLLLNDR